jgi:hypothetical protein
MGSCMSKSVGKFFMTGTTHVGYPTDKCVHQLFEEQVELRRSSWRCPKPSIR